MEKLISESAFYEAIYKLPIREKKADGENLYFLVSIADIFEMLERLPANNSEIPNSSDTISRAKAIDGKICIRRSNGVEIYDDYVVPVEYLEQLPPAQPKTGKWALQADDYHEYYECDQCGMAVGLDDVRNFCPNCGAEMEVTT